MRFFPSGRFLYKVVIAEILHLNFITLTIIFLFSDCYYFPLFSACQNSSLKVKDVAKIMNIRAAKADSVFSGHYTLSDDKVRLFSSHLKRFCKFKTFDCLILNCVSSGINFSRMPTSKRRCCCTFLHCLSFIFNIFYHCFLQVEAAVLYPGMRPTVLRIRLR